MIVFNLNSCKILKQLIALSATLLLLACASQPELVSERDLKLPLTLSAAPVSTPVDLALKAQAGRIEKVRYAHRLISQAIDQGQINQETEDGLNFTAETKTTAADESSMSQTVRVLEKSGKEKLQDFAMPELGETLQMLMTRKGKVLKAGSWPANSIYYVPPVSMPDEPVQVGDTWTMQSTWISQGDQIPYHLDMLSILKNFVQCGTDVCADIEMSGSVTLTGDIQRVMVFSSDWRGRMLFALGNGTVVWARVNTDEIFVYEKSQRRVRSCLESALQPNTDSTIDPIDPALTGLATDPEHVIVQPSCAGLKIVPNPKLEKAVQQLK